MNALWPNMNFHTNFHFLNNNIPRSCTETITKHKKYFFNDYDSKIACIFCLFRVYQRGIGNRQVRRRRNKRSIKLY